MLIQVTLSSLLNGDQKPGNSSRIFSKAGHPLGATQSLPLALFLCQLLPSGTLQVGPNAGREEEGSLQDIPQSRAHGLVPAPGVGGGLDLWPQELGGFCA